MSAKQIISSAIALLILMFSVPAYADTPVYTCSCDVNDQIDANGFIRGPVNQARGYKEWKVGELVVIQNGEFWRTYQYQSTGLFTPTVAGGEGDYPGNTQNNFGIDFGDPGGSIIDLDQYLINQALYRGFPPGAVIVIGGNGKRKRGIVTCIPACT